MALTCDGWFGCCDRVNAIFFLTGIVEFESVVYPCVYYGTLEVRMTGEPTIKFTFAVDDPELDDERRQKIATKLLREIRELDEVEKADRAEDLNPEVGSKPGFATLIGVLTAEVSIKNIKSFLSFLGDRLGDKPMKISVKLGEKEVNIEAKSRQDLLEAERIVLYQQDVLGLRDEDVASIESEITSAKEAEKLQREREQENDDLSSEKVVDYRQLRDLLAQRLWKEADQETLAVMLKVSGRQKEGWLDSESINNFPCTDLRTIDQLWVKYSNGRFGFSVQKKIMLEVGKKENAFCARVGWQIRGKWFLGGWLNEGSINWDDLSATEGHLPFLSVWGEWRIYWMGKKINWRALERCSCSYIASRRDL
jgi:GUN4-like